MNNLIYDHKNEDKTKIFSWWECNSINTPIWMLPHSHSQQYIYHKNQNDIKHAWDKKNKSAHIYSQVIREKYTFFNTVLHRVRKWMNINTFFWNNLTRR